MRSASREWRSGGTPTNDQTLPQKNTGSCTYKNSIRKYRVHFRRNICEYSFNKEYITPSVFRTHTILRIFTQTPHIKSKLKQFLLVVVLNFLSEKGQRIRRMSATCIQFRIITRKSAIRYLLTLQISVILLTIRNLSV